MPEFRRNPLTGDWVLYASERASRPNDFREPRDISDCPFCPGNEHLTPLEIAASRPAGSPPGSPDWRWRVFPNKFPALAPVDSEQPPETKDDRWRAAHGHHEVLVETPGHDADLACLPAIVIADALQACAVRIDALLREDGVRYVLVFKNRGHAAGASLRHPHFQIAALPFVPERVAAQLKGSRDRFEASGVCGCCDWIGRERREAARVVAATGDIAVIAPYAGRFPGETWIMPIRHTARFETSSAHLITSTADALRSLLRALKAWADDPPYNLIIHTAPSLPGVEPCFHWRIEVIPRLTGVAGFEWATGIHINQIAPEQAAMALRDNWD